MGILTRSSKKINVHRSQIGLDPKADTRLLAKLAAKKAFYQLSSLPDRVVAIASRRLKHIREHTTFHFIFPVADAASVQKALAQVSTAEAFFDVVLRTWSITDTAAITEPAYLTVRIDNAMFAKVIQLGDEGFKEVVEAIRGAECWKEGSSGVCFVEVRRL